MFGQMLGVHSRQRNIMMPPDRARGSSHAVAHPDGDLDAYVVHFDSPERFGGDRLKPLWNALSRRMHAMLPTASAAMVQELHKAQVIRQRHTHDIHMQLVSPRTRPHTCACTCRCAGVCTRRAPPNA